MEKAYELLTDEERLYIKDWYVLQNKDANLLSIINKNPFYFSRSITMCKNKTKAIKSIVILGTLNDVDCKKMFMKLFFEEINSIKELVVFLEAVKEVRGFGHIIKKVVYTFFRKRTVEKIKEELSSNIGNTKWTNRDILNKFHIKPWNPIVSSLFRYFVEREKKLQKNP